MKGHGIMTGAGGGGLNFAVVGGTSQPASPKDNTVWVNTPTEITDVLFSSEQPTVRTDGAALSGGEIWIQTGKTSVIPFNALKKSTLMVYPNVAYQYDISSATWVRQTARSYISSTWKDWVVLYYDYGEEYVDLTGGWVAYGMDDKAVKYDTYIYLEVDSTGNAWAYTNNPVDLTSISTLNFYIKRSHEGACRIGVNAVKPTSANNPLNSMAAMTKVASYVSTVTPYSVDVSALTGPYYLVFLEAGERDGNNWDYLYKVEGLQ